MFLHLTFLASDRLYHAVALLVFSLGLLLHVSRCCFVLLAVLVASNDKWWANNKFSAFLSSSCLRSETWNSTRRWWRRGSSIIAKVIEASVEEWENEVNKFAIGCSLQSSHSSYTWLGMSRFCLAKLSSCCNWDSYLTIWQGDRSGKSNIDVRNKLESVIFLY